MFRGALQVLDTVRPCVVIWPEKYYWAQFHKLFDISIGLIRYRHGSDDRMEENGCKAERREVVSMPPLVGEPCFAKFDQGHTGAYTQLLLKFAQHWPSTASASIPSVQTADQVCL
jgi:hypothetical protein